MTSLSIQTLLPLSHQPRPESIKYYDYFTQLCQLYALAIYSIICCKIILSVFIVMLFISIQTINLCANKLCNYRIVGIYYTAKHRYTQQSINSMKTLKSRSLFNAQAQYCWFNSYHVFNLPNSQQ